MDSVNERLRVFVEKKNFEQTEVAKKLNVSKQRVNGWLTNTSINMYVLSEILTVFPDLDARWLLTGEYTATGENPLIIEDPHHPYAKECTNPACKKELLDLIEKHQIEKDRLWSHIDDLTRKVGPPSENTSSGGVEEHRKTG